MALHAGTSSSGGGSDATITFTDITTNNSSTSKHGFLPKLDGNAAHYLDGTGAWSTPGGIGATPALEFVSSQTLLAAATDITFGSLNGDSDNRYVLFCNVKGGGVSTNNIRLYPNGGSSNLVDTYFAANAGSVSGGDGTGGIIGYVLTSGQVAIRTDIWAKSGLPRKWVSAATLDQPAYIATAAAWSDDSTNITSLVVHSTVALQFGIGSVFTLYKMTNG